MPAEGIHLTSLREAAASPNVPGAMRRSLVREEDAARFGAVLLDLPYFDAYAAEVLRYVAKLRPRPSRWGNVVHERAAVPILHAILDDARRSRSARLAAAAIDRQLHPLVNALARRHPDGRDHDAAHREVEKFHSICFHEAYYGADRMGTPGIARVVQVPMRELFADRVVAQAVTRAFAGAIYDPPSERALAAMGRGYEQHTALIASPVGKLVAPPAEKEHGRAVFFSGAWGSFDDLLAAAIAGSVPVLEAVWRVFDADGDDELDRARAALDARLGPGSIDTEASLDVLERPFSPTLE